MNILKRSEKIVYFEINSELKVTNFNSAFLKLFPKYQSDTEIPLSDFLNNFLFSSGQKQDWINCLNSNYESKQLRINKNSVLKLEVEQTDTGFCFLGQVSNSEPDNEFLENWNSIQMSGDVILLGNEKGEIIHANHKIAEFSGYSEDELIGKHISILFSAEELKIKPLRFDLLNEDKEYLAERKLQKKDQTTVHIEMLSKKVGSGYITNIRNIEQRVKTENELEEIRKRLLLVTKLERIGIIDLELSTDTVVYNDQMCKILDINEYHKCPDLDVWIKSIHEDDRNRVIEGLEMVKERGNTFEFVYRIKTRIKTKTIKASADVLYSENNQCRKLIISSIDISNSHELKNRLHELEHTFQSLANSATCIIQIYTEKFQYVNNTFEKVTGYSMVEALKMNFWDIVHPDHREMVKNRGMKRISGESQITPYDFKIISKDGEEKWIEFSAAGIKYLGEDAAIGSAFEITDRKKLELQLKENIQNLENEKLKVAESENRFKEYMLQNSAPMLVVSPPTKDIIFANNAACKLYGYSIEELLSMKIYDIQTITKEEVDRNMENAIRQSSNEFIFTQKTKNQSLITVRINASPVKNNGQTTMVLIISDITEELKTKTKLVDSHTTYKNILDSISEMLYILDEKGAFLYVNKAAVMNYQYSSREFIGKTPAFLSAPDKNDLKHVEQMLNMAFNGTQNTIYFWGLRKDKTIFPKEVVLSPGYYFGQKVVIAVSRDISEHIRITDELTLAKEKAEESDKLKSAFLANMSHEIRTPMNAILGFSELIKDMEMEQDERLKFINIINRSSHHLLNLINDLVDLSKIYSNQMQLEKSKFSLNSLFFEIYEFFESEIKNLGKKDALDLTISFGLPYGKDVIYTDETRLRQVLNNTIGNAIKFTKKGKIHFEYILQDAFLRFKITDTGIGIPDDQIKNVFNRFVQADQTISRKYGGTGLGLAISQACIILLGGEIWIESEVNKGTSVYFNIPYTLPA